MSKTFFIFSMALLIPALIAVLITMICLIVDELREGDRWLGLTMIAVLAVIAALAVIVAAALPWYLL